MFTSLRMSFLHDMYRLKAIMRFEIEYNILFDKKKTLNKLMALTKIPLTNLYGHVLNISTIAHLCQINASSVYSG